jgi:hypothetical protein
LAVLALTTFEPLLTFLGVRAAIENSRAHTPRAAMAAAPFLILLAVRIQIWARKDPRRRLIDNAAYGIMLIWSMSYAFVVSTPNLPLRPYILCPLAVTPFLQRRMCFTFSANEFSMVTIPRAKTR